MQFLPSQWFQITAFLVYITADKAQINPIVTLGINFPLTLSSLCSYTVHLSFIFLLSLSLSLVFSLISSPLCFIPLTLLFPLLFSCPDLSKFPSMPACCHRRAVGIWRDDQLKMMCFAAFFFTHHGCKILYLQQFRRRADTHWCQLFTMHFLFRCRLSMGGKRGANNMPAHSKVKEESFVLLLKEMSVGEQGVWKGEKPLR